MKRVVYEVHAYRQERRRSIHRFFGDGAIQKAFECANRMMFQHGYSTNVVRKEEEEPCRIRLL